VRFSDIITRLTKKEIPVFWFTDPDRIAIESQPSKISIQVDYSKRSLFEKISDQIFDVVFLIIELLIGLSLIIFPLLFTLHIYSQVVTEYLNEGTRTYTYEILIFMPIMVTVAMYFGSRMISGIDRKRSLTIDATNSQVKFENVNWPRNNTRILDIKTPISFEIKDRVRTITHSSGDSDSRSTWTTSHDGIDISFDLVGEGMTPLLFLEGQGTAPRSEFKPFLDLLFSTLKLDKDEQDEGWWAEQKN